LPGGDKKKTHIDKLIILQDGDTGRPRRIIYELVENPLDYFSIGRRTILIYTLVFLNDFGH
jgi:hypothetical protein